MRELVDRGIEEILVVSGIETADEQEQCEILHGAPLVQTACLEWLFFVSAVSSPNLAHATGAVLTAVCRLGAGQLLRGCNDDECER